MMKEIIITNDFKKSPSDVIGKFVVADGEVPNAIFELLKEHPDWFTFEVGYTINADGSKTLNEVSLVSKHVKVK